MQIAFVLYPGLTALDILGPYEVLKMLPGAELRFVATHPGPVSTDRGILVIGATHSFDETPNPDIVLVPGSEAKTGVAAGNGTLSTWLRSVHETTRVTASVCSGAVILAANDLLAGRPATTHWAAMDTLEKLGAKPQPSERIVRSGKLWTAAGVSAGIDLAFALVEEVADRQTAERIQLMIEYDPQPPQNSGHMNKATDVVASAARAEMARLSRNPQNGVAVMKVAWRKVLKKVRHIAPKARST